MIAPAIPRAMLLTGQSLAGGYDLIKQVSSTLGLLNVKGIFLDLPVSHMNTHSSHFQLQSRSKVEHRLTSNRNNLRLRSRLLRSPRPSSKWDEKEG